MSAHPVTRALVRRFLLWLVIWGAYYALATFLIGVSR